MAERTEAARLSALRQLNLLDTPPNEVFDRITRMAAQLFDLPIAAVSLTDHDRQWFKSRVGVDHTSIPRDKAPCAQVANTAEPLVIPDLLTDQCYRDSPLARSGIRFYAGASLTTREGLSLGAMCVLGMAPRQASAAELAALGDLAAMVMAQIELQHAFGRVDPLSGLSNRMQFLEDLEDRAKDCRHGTGCTAVVMDLASPEQLSSVSRVLGSAFVDDMVHEAALALSAALGPSVKAYHVGATQLAFLVPEGADAVAYVEAVAAGLSHARDRAGSRHATTLATGLAPFVLGRTAPRDVLRMAQDAAEEARRARVGVSVFSLLQDGSHRRRFTLLNEFGHALEAVGELHLTYQPRVDIASGRCTGAEALLRWTHPTLGVISPSEFIPIVEQTSLARATTTWVLEAALRQLASWAREGLELRLSVNVSATNLTEPDLAERVLQRLARYRIDPGCLELEVTESAIMENAEQALSLLATLAERGVRLAIDDFGTGYSSLAYLQRLPAHVVKIDQSFMRDLTTDKRARTLVRTMISLSHDLGYRVVAEGVETAQTLDLLRQAGCDEAQGYLFARPMDADHFRTWPTVTSALAPTSCNEIACHRRLLTNGVAP